MSIYDIEVKTNRGEKLPLSAYEGQVLLIVNTATKCGLAPQFNELQELYQTYKDQGFNVLGFPCNQFLNQEPVADENIEAVCELNHGVTFPLFAKIDVNGKNAHPLYQYLTDHARGFLGSKAIKWNFTKFLIDRKGNIVKRYAPTDKPKAIEEKIKSLL